MSNAYTMSWKSITSHDVVWDDQNYFFIKLTKKSVSIKEISECCAAVTAGCQDQNPEAFQEWWGSLGSHSHIKCGFSSFVRGFGLRAGAVTSVVKL